ncbi:MAG: sulfite exporter TauE/SafE family protein [Euryarchaeota archaeon]|nr:sulfite exporter TauE/SafE family protein [Euryarchaeota archaeon]
MLEGWLVAIGIFVAAVIYSSVGHGGATAYLAVLMLAGFAPADVAAPVLVINVAVAGIAFANYKAAGHFRPRVLVPFALASVPAAFIGGSHHIEPRVQALILGTALLFAAARLLLLPTLKSRPIVEEGSPTFFFAALGAGASLGFLAGATGIGGGIFLSPLLILAGWTDAKGAAPVAAAFIVLNSVSGLAARALLTDLDLSLLWALGPFAVLGGLLGSRVGAFRLSALTVQRSLGAVLAIAATRTLAPALL